MTKGLYEEICEGEMDRAVVDAILRKGLSDGGNDISGAITSVIGSGVPLNKLVTPATIAIPISIKKDKKYTTHFCL